MLHWLFICFVVLVLTFTGANVDIYIGASAPFVAPLAANAGPGGAGKRIGIAWNILGLLALGNVVIRAIITSPGPTNWIHTDPPNRTLITFPFMFIPAFFVPLAVSLHLVSLRIHLNKKPPVQQT
jgi:hypothetical protein